MKLTIRAARSWAGRILFACLLACSAKAEPSLTIYNQNFAVVRDAVSLDLKSGTNQVRFSGATADLEPSSVILRDPSGKHQFQVLEQNFRGDPISQGMLLALNEGKSIEFESISQQDGRTKRERVRGKIIRSGYSSPREQNYGNYGGGGLQPIIEVNGQLRFSLPGEPIFPALADNTILMPTLVWVIESAKPARFDAELSYVTSEMSWEADYNLALPESGNTLDLVGWVTMDNESGKSFENARIALIAGEVSKIQNPNSVRFRSNSGGGGGGGAGAPPVTEKSFDEYHLYTLQKPTTLLDREKKQVEFVRAAGVRSERVYIYDGASTDQDQNWNPQTVNTQPEYGTQGNKQIWVMREFTNSAANSLGLPLPKGRVRIYRRNTDGQMEFTGENIIKHTPRDEVIRLYTGNAFDLVGERKQTEFKVNLGLGPGLIDANGLPVGPTGTNGTPYIDESFEITLRNHKKEAVDIWVVEHLYRWVNWEIKEKSESFQKTDAQTIEFRMLLKPDEERKVTYKVRYSW